MNVSKSIKVAMAKREMSAVQLAQALGVNRPAVSQIFMRNVVKTDMLQRMAKVFGMKVSELIALGED